MGWSTAWRLPTAPGALGVTSVEPGTTISIQQRPSARIIAVEKSFSRASSAPRASDWVERSATARSYTRRVSEAMVTTVRTMMTMMAVETMTSSSVKPARTGRRRVFIG